MRSTDGPHDDWAGFVDRALQAGRFTVDARERHALVQTVRRHAELALSLDAVAMAQPCAAKDFTQVLLELARG